MRTTLDPKQDIVFKMLFADARNRRLLISLLNAVLVPAEPFTNVEVLNPDTHKQTVHDKGALLDVRARVKGGKPIAVQLGSTASVAEPKQQDRRRVDLEMQRQRTGWERERGLFYWAREYGSQLVRGDDYTLLEPTVGIFILNFLELQAERYHSIFRLFEVHDGQEYSRHLELHILELPKLPPGPANAASPEVVQWSKFLTAETDEELEQLAMNNPDLRTAKEALERLSADPQARELAKERELAQWNYDRTLRLAREEGAAQGKAEGRAEGKAEFLLRQLTRRFAPLPEDVQKRVAAATQQELDLWADRILTADSLQAVFGE